MKRILLPATLITVLLWLITQNAEVLNLSQGFIALRKTLIILTGAVSLLWMSFTLVLATRPAWLERRLGGLDRMYRLHKWSGIGASLLVLAHWLLEKSPAVLLQLGLLEPRPRQPHGARSLFVGLAKDAGEWAFYLMIAVVLIALIRRIPYKYFRQLHKVFPLLFLMGAYHSVVLLPQSYASQPLGWLVYALAAIGSVAALLCLSGRVGRARQYDSQVTQVTHSAAGISDLTLATPRGWPGHEAGQFALLTFDRREGAHPFTIAGVQANGEASGIRFAIKALGDYTQTLAAHLQAGSPARIEGPYGRFDFEDGSTHQIWVAGGIGVTPFMARLQALAAQPSGAQANIDFYYATQNAANDAFPPELDALCARAGVRLHRRIQAQQGVFQSREIFGGLDGERSSVWFCGPQGWAHSLRQYLRSQGFDARRFHAEAFDFR